jgi:zona occludens toxin
MIFLITGEPGAGKTLNTIKLICEDEQFQDRSIYYHGISGLSTDWEEIDADQVQKWYELPHGSVVVIDECQHHFKPRRTGSELPKAVLEMSTHRHRGFDLVLITQHPTLIDAGLRKFVNRHYHFERPFNTQRPRRIEFQQVANDPRDYHARQNAITTTVNLDKKYFNKYKSAEIHTHKMRLPFKVYALAAFCCLLLFGALHFANNMTGKYRDHPANSGQSESSSFSPFSSDSEVNVDRSDTMSDSEYFAMWKPRIDGLPHTAPAYDELNTPKVRPLPNCVLWSSGQKKGLCTCYTQQGTKMGVPQNLCSDLVHNGFFDPAREVTTDEPRQNRSVQKKAQPLPTAPNVSYIPHTNDRTVESYSRRNNG